MNSIEVKTPEEADKIDIQESKEESDKSEAVDKQADSKVDDSSKTEDTENQKAEDTTNDGVKILNEVFGTKASVTSTEESSSSKSDGDDSTSKEPE